MSSGSIRIEDSTLKRLKQYLAQKYKGEMYGKIGETVNDAIKEYLDRHEKVEKSEFKKEE